MKRKILTVLISICAVIMCLTVKCQAFSFFSGNEESDAGCAWVQDDGFYYIPDLEGEDSENVRMAESNVTSQWQYIGSDGAITDELWNFNSIGAGSKLLGFSENRKYIYFFNEMSDQMRTGTLCYIQTKYLTDPQMEAKKHIIKVDSDVFASARPVICKDGGIVYNKETEEQYKSVLYYFDGKQTIEITKHVSDFAVSEGDIIYYTRWKEYSERKDNGRSGEYDLYCARIGKKDSEKQIGTDIYNSLNGSKKVELFYLNEGKIYFLEKGETFCCYSGDGKKEILINDNAYTIQWEKEKVLYVHKDKTIKMQDFFECSQSVHKTEDIEQFFEKMQDMYGDFSMTCGSVHMYDCKKGKDQSLSEKCRVISTEDEGGNYNILFFPFITQGENGVVLSYVDITSIEKIFASKKIPIDDILSNPAYSLEDEDAISDIVDDAFNTVYEELYGDNSLLQYYVESAGSGKPIYLQDMSIEELEELDSEMPLVYLFNDGQNFAIDEGPLIVGTVSDGYCADRKVIEDEITGVMVISGKLFYEKNNTIYWYDGDSSISIGSVYDDNETYYKGYDDGTVLMLVYYSGRQYGGTLVKIGTNEYEIDSNVTDFWELESGDILYISEGKLILYSGNVKTRIADSVKFAWPLSEKKITDYVKQGW